MSTPCRLDLALLRYNLCNEPNHEGPNTCCLPTQQVRRLLAVMTNACTGKKRPAEGAERIALRRAVHNLADLSKTGVARPAGGFERNCCMF